MISIALATYNGEKYISAQLESLLLQTVHPNELVIFDDRSTDRTVDILESFKATAPFPVYIKVNEYTLGYRDNFMRAALACKSSYIAFCDQDDIWDSTKIEFLIREIKSHQCLLLEHGFRVIDHVGKSIETYKDALPFPRTDPWTSVLGMTQVFDRSLLKYSGIRRLSVDHNSPKEKMAHDQWIHFLATVFGSYKHIPNRLLSYRQHGGNTCGLKISVDNTQTDLKAIKVLLKFLKGDAQGFHEKRRLLKGGLERFMEGALGRAQVLEALAEVTDDKIQNTKVMSSLVYYRAFYKKAAKRLFLYSSRPRRAKLKKLAENIFRGVYYEEGASGLKLLCLDVIFGVPYC